MQCNEHILFNDGNVIVYCMCLGVPATQPEARVCRNLVSLPVLNLDRLRQAKALVDKAVKVSQCSRMCSNHLYVHMNA